MKPTVQDIRQAIDRFAPFEMALAQDNVGLLVGDPAQSVDTVLVALDVCEPVVQEAEALGAQLIVTHHPVLFEPARRIVRGDPDTGTVYRLARAGLSLIAAHTNLDRAVGGINDELAGRLGWRAETVGEFLRVGALPEAMTGQRLSQLVQGKLGGSAQWIGPTEQIVRRFAICGGSGGSEIVSAKMAGADVLITGEVKHSDALAAWDLGLGLILLGHGASEICAVDLLQKHLQNASDALQWSLHVKACSWKLLL